MQTLNHVYVMKPRPTHPVPPKRKELWTPKLGRASLVGDILRTLLHINTVCDSMGRGQLRTPHLDPWSLPMDLSSWLILISILSLQ